MVSAMRSSNASSAATPPEAGLSQYPIKPHINQKFQLGSARRLYLGRRSASLALPHPTRRISPTVAVDRENRFLFPREPYPALLNETTEARRLAQLACEHRATIGTDP